ncbi:phosphoglycolate phosphatase [Thiorhodococcus drewsii AZ1]|uniref:Phosphoglycolate phosphatase n=1 Tax=Thiorhodococcus drewsii AZ1 TaxID=765913 RepID=G2DWQ6_9GAMM|nr:HAD-IA family hydrolase [Thiorhodococcus drewsii]EGV33756.1 phosphoglycolate phosphatase [Thiorhodococcus drewsii AZ1]
MPERSAVRDGAVLFDLDGTFADTAPDMAAALDRLHARHSKPVLPFEQVRPYVSHGARGMLQVGFGLTPEDPDFEPLKTEFLELYTAALVERTRPFPGIPELVDALEARGIPWGIVTNKLTALTEPLMEQLGFRERAACIVCGDTTPRPKPHPDPLLHAARLLGIEPARCWYIGDDARDIHAGLAAGMGTLAALFGYLGTETAPTDWGAHGLIAHPLETLDWLSAPIDS